MDQCFIFIKIDLKYNKKLKKGNVTSYSLKDAGVFNRLC